MSKKDAHAPVAVLEYLNRQNRPYSAVDIHSNLHKEYGKTAVVKALESLAAMGKISEKLNNKQKVYVAVQSQFPDVDEAEMKRMDAKILELNGNVTSHQTVLRQLDSESQALNKALTTEEAQQQLTQVKQQIVHDTEKLKQLKSNVNSVSPAERQQIMKKREKFVKEWRKRKRMANDILNAILEGYPKSKKELYEDIGIETDEDYKVKPPEL